MELNTGNIFTNKTTNNVSKLKYSLDDYDVSQSLVESLLMVEESCFEINKNHTSSIHLGLREASVEILTEGFTDFINSVIEFFKGLLEKFKDFMKKIFMILNAYFGDFDKFLTKYKDKLNELDPDFSISGYKYTFNTAIPKIDKIQAIILDYNNEISELDKLKKEDILKDREAFMSDDNLDKIRAYVLGQSGGIDKEEYLKEVRKVFRNGEEEEIDIDIDKSELRRIIEGYSAMKKMYNDSIKERDKIISLVESIKKFFERSASTYYRGNNKAIGAHSINVTSGGSSVTRDQRFETSYQAKRLDIINTFFNFKFAQSKEVGSMATTAMVEKVNALKEALKFYRVVVRKSMFNTKDTKKEGEK